MVHLRSADYLLTDWNRTRSTVCNPSACSPLLPPFMAWAWGVPATRKLITVLLDINTDHTAIPCSWMLTTDFFTISRIIISLRFLPYMFFIVCLLGTSLIYLSHKHHSLSKGAIWGNQWVACTGPSGDRTIEVAISSRIALRPIPFDMVVIVYFKTALHIQK